ncbi:GldG family protein [Thermohalobacter berrensis]|uniref:Uncharacterized protein n=1 Tax=Thermohalobacter berrensis TaxID=99594 RepID=A0A419T5Z3_9FIRM|nr:GldG family protein [Thermohalobacter berrensis]RKD32964.1 hypothetical protein BET03_10130 [Thermohalobacter berrensis]
MKGLFNKKLKYGTNSIIITILVIALIVFINVVTFNHNFRIDMTKNKVYSLSDQTINVIKKLEKEVEIIGFFKDDSQLLPQIAELLKEYKHESNKIKYSLMDFDANQVEANKYGVTDYDTVVLKSRDKTIVLNKSDFYKVDFRTNTKVFAGEEALTQGILDVTLIEKNNIYLVEGHGELSGDKLYLFTKAIKGEGYNVASLNIAKEKGIPKDADLLIIPAPITDYSSDELFSLQQYVDKGGRVLILMRTLEDQTNIRKFLMFIEGLGIKVDNNIIIDPERNYFGQAETIIPKYTIHPIVNKLKEKGLALIMPYSLSIEKLDNSNYTGQFYPLLETSNSAWGETNLENSEPKLDERDKKGPLTIAAVTVKPIKNGETKVAVVGNAAIVTNELINKQGNMDFLINTINFLQDKEELISIRPKEHALEPLDLKGNEGKYLFGIFVIGIPVIIFIIGLVVFLRRRNR